MRDPALSFRNLDHLFPEIRHPDWLSQLSFRTLRRVIDVRHATFSRDGFYRAQRNPTHASRVAAQLKHSEFSMFREVLGVPEFPE
jgi:hypothetical protein